MKFFKSLILFLISSFAFMGANAQDPAINVVLGSSGIVNVGGTIFLQVDVLNNSVSGNIVVNKVRPQISVPASISFIPATGHILPAGWTIFSNTGSVIRFTNTTDAIPPGVTRTAFIAIQGTAVGAGSVLANITYNGVPPSGDNTANNTSSAGLTVNPAAACAIAVSATAETIACNGGTTTLTATASGTLNTIEYSLNAGAFQAGNTFTVNAAGSPYTVTAREVATPSCTANSSAVTITQPAAVVATASITSPIATAGGTGSITVSASGGTAGTTTFAIASGPVTNTTGLNSGVFTGLTQGTYTFTATKAGCTSAASSNVVLNDPAACIISGVSASAGTIACNGGTTTLTATATGGAPAVEYSLNGGVFQASNIFTVNAAGSPYTITARETGNAACAVTSSSVPVTQPAVLAATAVVSTPIAVPGGTGSITVSTTGGTGAKTFVITSGTTTNTTGATSGVFSGLLAGSYTFTASDANGCTALTAATNLANPGVSTADPAVGQMFFTTTAGAVQNANALLLAPAANLYDINVPFYNLNQLNPVPNGTINFTINLGSKLVLAPGFNLATAPLSAYFSWSQAIVGAGNVVITGTQIATIPADFNAIAIFRVKGDSACRSNVVSNIVITNVLQTLADDDLQNNQSTLQYTLPITLTKSQVNVTCNGAANGIVNITATSGTVVVTTSPGGYTNTTGLASGVNNFTLNNLAPGTYTITASASSDPSLANCTASTTVTIVQPAVLALPPASITSTNNNCFNATAGTITVVATGGTAPYTYTIAGTTVNTTGANSGVFTGLAAGSYTVTVTDNNLCTVITAAILITQPVGGIPDITLGSDITSSFFATPGVTQTIVYNVAEIGGNSAVGDTIRITKVAGFTINFNSTIFSTVVGSTTYALDNPRWKIDNSNPAFVSIILTDPSNPGGPGILLCNQLVNVAVTITRNTSNISTFTLSARLRRANGEVNLGNNLNSIIMAAD